MIDRTFTDENNLLFIIFYYLLLFINYYLIFMIWRIQGFKHGTTRYVLTFPFEFDVAHTSRITVIHHFSCQIFVVAVNLCEKYYFLLFTHKYLSFEIVQHTFLQPLHGLVRVAGCSCWGCHLQYMGKFLITQRMEITLQHLNVPLKCMYLCIFLEKRNSKCSTIN